MKKLLLSKLIFSLTICFLNIGNSQAGPRDFLCSAFEGVANVLSETCEEGSYDEYNLVSRCFNVGDRIYRHPGVESLDFSGETGQELADDLTQEVLYNVAAKRIYDANQCEFEAFNDLSKSSPSTTAVQTLEYAKSTFQHIKGEIRNNLDLLTGSHTTPDGPDENGRFFPGEIPEKLKKSSRERLCDIRENLSQSHLAANRSRCQSAIEINRRNISERPLHEIEARTSSIPFGDRREVRALIIKAANENWSEDRFLESYKVQMQAYKDEASVPLQNIGRHLLIDGDCRDCFNIREGKEVHPS